MKALIIVTAAVCIGLLSCNKDNVPAPSLVTTTRIPPIEGTWRLVSDTTHSVWIANASNPTGDYVSVYTGTASDYYSFTSSGAFALKQGSGLNSGTYSLKDNTLTLTSTNSSPWQNAAAFQVIQLSDHSMVLSAGVASPGGPITNIITLAK